MMDFGSTLRQLHVHPISACPPMGPAGWDKRSVGTGISAIDAIIVNDAGAHSVQAYHIARHLGIPGRLAPVAVLHVERHRHCLVLETTGGNTGARSSVNLEGECP